MSTRSSGKTIVEHVRTLVVYSILMYRLIDRLVRFGIQFYELFVLPLALRGYTVQ